MLCSKPTRSAQARCGVVRSVQSSFPARCRRREGSVRRPDVQSRERCEDFDTGRNFAQRVLWPTTRRDSREATCKAASLSPGGAASQSSTTRILAVILGYCVLVGSLFRSLPQIVKIVKSESVEGLSLVSFTVELFAYSIIWAYNFNNAYPFSTYGDIVACWVQDVILVFLVLKLRRLIDAKVVLCSILFAAFTAALMFNVCGLKVLAGLQASTILVISFGSRLPQILMNARRGDSGQLSLLTCLLNVLGCISRLFTTLVLTQDALNFGGTALQTILNGILLYQTVKTSRKRREGNIPASPAPT